MKLTHGERIVKNIDSQQAGCIQHDVFELKNFKNG